MQYLTNFKRLALISAFLVLGGCVTKFPTDYELDRRSGSTPASGIPGIESLSNYSLRDAPMTPDYMPVRSQPVVTKVWVYDRRLGPNWLQGTWMFIEVQPSQWVTELEPRSNNFVQRYASDTPPQTREVKREEKSGSKAQPDTKAQPDNRPRSRRAPAAPRAESPAPESLPNSRAESGVQESAEEKPNEGSMSRRMRRLTAEPQAAQEQAPRPQARARTEDSANTEDSVRSRRRARLESYAQPQAEEVQSPESFTHLSSPRKSRRHE